ncbi:hypothetical protein Pelo_15897 [Pelomyxa schiedti]|nr:hypothetical protein Pelo_15897 [Pelomyxa schiedti]
MKVSACVVGALPKRDEPLGGTFCVRRPCARRPLVPPPALRVAGDVPFVSSADEAREVPMVVAVTVRGADAGEKAKGKGAGAASGPQLHFGKHARATVWAFGADSGSAFAASASSSGLVKGKTRTYVLEGNEKIFGKEELVLCSFSRNGVHGAGLLVSGEAFVWDSAPTKLFHIGCPTKRIQSKKALFPAVRVCVSNSGKHVGFLCESGDVWLWVRSQTQQGTSENHFSFSHLETHVQANMSASPHVGEQMQITYVNNEPEGTSSHHHLCNLSWCLEDKGKTSDSWKRTLTLPEELGTKIVFQWDPGGSLIAVCVSNPKSLKILFISGSCASPHEVCLTDRLNQSSQDLTTVELEWIGQGIFLVGLMKNGNLYVLSRLGSVVQIVNNEDEITPCICVDNPRLTIYDGKTLCSDPIGINLICTGKVNIRLLSLPQFNFENMITQLVQGNGPCASTSFDNHILAWKLYLSAPHPVSVLPEVLFANVESCFIPSSCMSKTQVMCKTLVSLNTSGLSQLCWSISWRLSLFFATTLALHSFRVLYSLLASGVLDTAEEFEAGCYAAFHILSSTEQALANVVGKAGGRNVRNCTPLQFTKQWAQLSAAMQQRPLHREVTSTALSLRNGHVGLFKGGDNNEVQKFWITAGSQGTLPRLLLHISRCEITDAIQLAESQIERFTLVGDRISVGVLGWVVCSAFAKDEIVSFPPSSSTLLSRLISASQAPKFPFNLDLKHHNHPVITLDRKRLLASSCNRPGWNVTKGICYLLIAGMTTCAIEALISLKCFVMALAVALVHFPSMLERVSTTAMNNFIFHYSNGKQEEAFTHLCDLLAGMQAIDQHIFQSLLRQVLEHNVLLLKKHIEKLPILVHPDYIFTETLTSPWQYGSGMIDTSSDRTSFVQAEMWCRAEIGRTLRHTFHLLYRFSKQHFVSVVKASSNFTDQFSENIWKVLYYSWYLCVRDHVALLSQASPLVSVASLLSNKHATQLPPSFASWVIRMSAFHEDNQLPVSLLQEYCINALQIVSAINRNVLETFTLYFPSSSYISAILHPKFEEVLSSYGGLASILPQNQPIANKRIYALDKEYMKHMQDLLQYLNETNFEDFPPKLPTIEHTPAGTMNEANSCLKLLYIWFSTNKTLHFGVTNRLPFPSILAPFSVQGSFCEEYNWDKLELIQPEEIPDEKKVDILPTTSAGEYGSEDEVPLHTDQNQDDFPATTSCSEDDECHSDGIDATNKAIPSTTGEDDSDTNSKSDSIQESGGSRNNETRQPPSGDIDKSTSSVITNNLSMTSSTKHTVGASGSNGDGGDDDGDKHFSFSNHNDGPDDRGRSRHHTKKPTKSSGHLKVAQPSLENTLDTTMNSTKLRGILKASQKIPKKSSSKSSSHKRGASHHTHNKSGSEKTAHVRHKSQHSHQRRKGSSSSKHSHKSTSKRHVDGHHSPTEHSLQLSYSDKKKPTSHGTYNLECEQTWCQAYSEPSLEQTLSDLVLRSHFGHFLERRADFSLAFLEDIEKFKSMLPPQIPIPRQVKIPVTNFAMKIIRGHAKFVLETYIKPGAPKELTMIPTPIANGLTGIFSATPKLTRGFFDVVEATVIDNLGSSFNIWHIGCHTKVNMHTTHIPTTLIPNITNTTELTRRSNSHTQTIHMPILMNATTVKWHYIEAWNRSPQLRIHTCTVVLAVTPNQTPNALHNLVSNPHTEQMADLEADEPVSRPVIQIPKLPSSKSTENNANSESSIPAAMLLSLSQRKNNKFIVPQNMALPVPVPTISPRDLSEKVLAPPAIPSEESFPEDKYTLLGFPLNPESESLRLEVAALRQELADTRKMNLQAASTNSRGASPEREIVLQLEEKGKLQEKVKVKPSRHKHTRSAQTKKLKLEARDSSSSSERSHTSSLDSSVTGSSDDSTSSQPKKKSHRSIHKKARHPLKKVHHDTSEENETDELDDWLHNIHLLKYKKSLRHLGVTSPSHLQYVTVGDLCTMGMKVVDRQILMNAIEASFPRNPVELQTPQPQPLRQETCMTSSKPSEEKNTTEEHMPAVTQIVHAQPVVEYQQEYQQEYQPTAIDSRVPLSYPLEYNPAIMYSSLHTPQPSLPYAASQYNNDTGFGDFCHYPPQSPLPSQTLGHLLDTPYSGTVSHSLPFDVSPVNYTTPHLLPMQNQTLSNSSAFRTAGYRQPIEAQPQNLSTKIHGPAPVLTQSSIRSTSTHKVPNSMEGPRANTVSSRPKQAVEYEVSVLKNKLLAQKEELLRNQERQQQQYQQADKQWYEKQRALESHTRATVTPIQTSGSIVKKTTSTHTLPSLEVPEPVNMYHDTKASTQHPTASKKSH